MQCAKQWQRIEDESRDAKPKKENGKKTILQRLWVRGEGRDMPNQKKTNEKICRDYG